MATVINPSSYGWGYSFTLRQNLKLPNTVQHALAEKKFVYFLELHTKKSVH